MCTWRRVLPSNRLSYTRQRRTAARRRRRTTMRTDEQRADDASRAQRFVDDLRTMAASVPDGPWFVVQPTPRQVPLVADNVGPLVSVKSSRSAAERAALAPYIATFDPVMLRLIADLFERIGHDRDRLLDLVGWLA